MGGPSASSLKGGWFTEGPQEGKGLGGAGPHAGLSLGPWALDKNRPWSLRT